MSIVFLHGGMSGIFSYSSVTVDVSFPALMAVINAFLTFVSLVARRDICMTLYVERRTRR